MFLNLRQAIEALSSSYCPVIDQLEGRLLTQDWHSSVLASASDLPFFFLPPVPTRLSISASNWSTWEESKQLYAYVQCVPKQPECWGYRCTGSASPSCRSALVPRGPFELTPSDPARCKDQAGKVFKPMALNYIKRLIAHSENIIHRKQKKILISLHISIPLCCKLWFSSRVRQSWSAPFAVEIMLLKTGTPNKIDQQTVSINLRFSIRVDLSLISPEASHVLI